MQIESQHHYDTMNSLESTSYLPEQSHKEPEKGERGERLVDKEPLHYEQNGMGWYVSLAGVGAGAAKTQSHQEPKTMLVLGATSDIAKATINALIPFGWSFHLAGRNLESLRQIADDVSVRSGKRVAYSYFDAVTMDIEQMQRFWDNVVTCSQKTPVYDEPALGERDAKQTLQALFCAVGSLGEQKRAEMDCAFAQSLIRANFSGVLPVISLAANYFEAQRSGHIVVISSVAGERGRGSNYVYGAAKAGLSAFLSGLRVRLHASNVQVLTVLPGFVHTNMVAGLELPAVLTITPEQAARDIVKAMVKGKPVLYTKWWWRYIMLIIKHIPERVFIRLRNL